MSGSSKDVLTSAHHRSYVSQSGLAAVLQSIRDNGTPKALSRSSIKRARDAALPSDIFTSINIEMESGEIKQFPIVSPMVLLKHLVGEVESFSRFFGAQLTKYRNSSETKWRLAIYSDEIVPGNVIKPKNDRKLVALYWSFEELDTGTSCEDCWFVLTCVRSNALKQIKDGWSQLFRVAVEKFFESPMNVANGVMLQIQNHGPHLFFAKVGLVIGDEQAVKNCWASKGASGSMPCFFCANITLRGLDLWANDSTGYLRSHTEVDVSKLQFLSDRNLKERVQFLKDQVGQVSGAAFAKMEQALGLNYAPLGALYSDSFWNLLEGGPITVTQYDWMHTLLVSGAWNNETGLLFHLIKDHLSTKQADEFLSKFKWPNQWEGRGATGKRCLQKHVADGGEVKASASEGLSIYSVIRLLLMESSL